MGSLTSSKLAVVSEEGATRPADTHSCTHTHTHTQFMCLLEKLQIKTVDAMKWSKSFGIEAVGTSEVAEFANNTRTVHHGVKK